MEIGAKVRRRGLIFRTQYVPQQSESASVPGIYLAEGNTFGQERETRDSALAAARLPRTGRFDPEGSLFRGKRGTTLRARPRDCGNKVTHGHSFPAPSGRIRSNPCKKKKNPGLRRCAGHADRRSAGVVVCELTRERACHSIATGNLESSHWLADDGSGVVAELTSRNQACAVSAGA